MRLRGTAALLLFLPLPSQEGHHFSHPELGFAMTLPAEFFREGEDLLANPRTLTCWIAPSDANRPWTRLCAERVDALPAGANRMTFVWKGRDLQGGRLEVEAREGPVAFFAALVPLRTETVRLIASAPASEQSRAQAALVATLASLEGEPRWKSSTERAEAAGTRVGQIGAVIFALGVGMWIMKRRQQRKAS